MLSSASKEEIEAVLPKPELDRGLIKCSGHGCQVHKCLLGRPGNATNHWFSRQPKDSKNECKLVTQKDGNNESKLVTLKDGKNECKLVTLKDDKNECKLGPQEEPPASTTCLSTRNAHPGPATKST